MQYIHTRKAAWAAKIAEISHRTPAMPDASRRGAEPTGGGRPGSRRNRRSAARRPRGLAQHIRKGPADQGRRHAAARHQLDLRVAPLHLHDRFGDASPFRRRCIDLRTLVMVAMGAGYRVASKTTMPQHWRTATGHHSHVAIDDATEQGQLFFRIVRELSVQRGDVALALEPTALAAPTQKGFRRQRRERRRG